MVLFGLVNFNRIALAQENPELNSHLVVLQYHHVADDTPAVTSIKPDDFIEHLNYLADNQFNVVDLPEALQKIRAGESLADKSVAITFDDGYANLLDVALPELEKRGWPATIFVNPGLLKKHASHYMSWQQLKTWQNKKMTIANHGWQHDYWVRQPDNMTSSEWQKQVKDSILSTEKAIEAQLGSSPRLVAFPYGEYDNWLTDWLKDNELIGFGQQSGVIAPYSDFTALPRFPASGNYTNLKTLKVKLNSKALPVNYNKLPSPLLASESNPPSVSLHWLNSVPNRQQLACYVTSQPKAKIVEQDKVSQVTAQQSLNKGRSRYNCTLPIADGSGRFYWFSQAWLVNPK